MFALFATVMFGVLGLAIDLGFAFSERRTIQNSADLAAIAGARAVVRYDVNNDDPAVPDDVAALPDIANVIAGNQMGNSVPSLVPDSCKYLDYSGVSQGPCSIDVPGGATGVSLTVQESHATFFIRIFPGAPANLTINASARAYVERTQNAGFDSPIITCGYGSKLTNGTEVDILSNNTTINPDAIGQTFRLTGANTSTTTVIGRCGLPNSTNGNTWRGAALQYDNTNPSLKEVDDHWMLQRGATGVQTGRAVEGIEGCPATDLQPFGSCILMVPIACGTDHGCPGYLGTGTTTDYYKLYVVKILAFRVNASCTITNCSGILLDDFLLSEMTYPGGGGWCRDCGGVVGIKLSD